MDTKHITTVAASAALLALGWFAREAVGFRASPRGERPADAPAVTVITATNAVFNPHREYVGHVEPVQETDILPQIDGYIRRVCFTEGEQVRQGDLLFEIDAEQYVAARNLRHSEVASAQAKVAVAQAEVERAERYHNRLAAADDRSVSAMDRDTAETALSSAKAALNAAKAVVEQAKASAAIADFNLRHTKVLSPISGRIGKALHHVGDYVSPSKSALARVVRTDPVRVVFPVSDRDYASWQTEIARAEPSRRLRLVLPDGTEYGHTGVIDFKNNEVNRATGTLALHVAFPNPDERLIANAFVRVLADRKKPPVALVVPTAALVRVDDGLQAWKIDADDRVHPVPVETDGEWNGLSRVVKGLSPGDRLIGVGAFKLKDGEKVRVFER